MEAGVTDAVSRHKVACAIEAVLALADTVVPICCIGALDLTPVDTKRFK